MANFYWYGGTGNWSDFTNHWSDNSGNSPSSPKTGVPTSSDDVFIDSNSGFGSGGTITVNQNPYFCKNFTSTTGHLYTIIADFEVMGGALEVYGSFTLESGVTFNLQSLQFLSTSAGKTITTAGVTLDVGYVGFYETVDGGWTLQDNLLVSGYLDLENGTFDANDHNVTANDFYFHADTGYTPTVIMGSGTWEATGSGNVWYVDEDTGQVVTITPETSTIKINNATTTAKTFIGGGKTYNNIWFTGAGTGTFDITGSNTFNDFKVDTPPHTVRFTQGTTTTLTTFTVLGTAGNLITLTNITGITQHILFKSSGIVSCDYLDISNSNATGGATWNASTVRGRSIDGGNNTGWIFAKPLIKQITLLGVS